MDVLILSCSTGGGHNAAGAAIRDELLARGNRAELIDPYSLVSAELPVKVGNIYVRTAQRAPWLFGMIYAAGDLVRYIPVKSPIYLANIRVAVSLSEYIRERHFDFIVTSFFFPAEMLT